MPTCLTKVIALTILLLVLVLLAFGGALSREQATMTPEMHDYRSAELFRGSEGGKTLARACGNCHSNQTNLPWYGHVVPISWWIERHVREGRQELNFTEANEQIYGKKLEAKQIVLSDQVGVPAAAEQLVSTLETKTRRHKA
jgi:hypothetical protein